MARNTGAMSSHAKGKHSEAEFERRIAIFDPKVVLHRLLDTHAVSSARAGLTGRSFRQSMVMVSQQPADYVVISERSKMMFYAEIKAMTSTVFQFSRLERGQKQMGEMATRALPQSYVIFLHHHPTDRWYILPYALVRVLQGAGHNNVSLGALTEHTWSPP